MKQTSSKREYALALKFLRRVRNLSQVELSARTGIPKSQLSRYESNLLTPSISALERISEALDFPLLEMISLAEEASKEKPSALKGDFDDLIKTLFNSFVLLEKSLDDFPKIIFHTGVSNSELDISKIKVKKELLPT